MLRDWLTAAFFCAVFLLVLHLVSVIALWFALLAVGYALLPAVGYALLDSFHHFSPSRRGELLCERIVASRVAPLSSFHHWLVCCGSVSDSHHLLLGCGSFCNISLNTGFLAVTLSLILIRDTLWQVTSSWVPRLPPTPLLSIHTLLFLTCSDDFLSFSGHRHPASQCHSHCGQMRLRVLFLTLLSPTLLNCADQSSCWMRNSVFSLSFLLVAELSLSAECGLLFGAPSLFVLAMCCLSADCGRLCCPGFVPRCRRALPRSGGLSCRLTQSRAPSTSGTVSLAAHPCCVELLTLSYHLSQARRLGICNIEPGDCAAVCEMSASLQDLTVSHSLGQLFFSWHVWSRCSFLRDLDLFLKLRQVEEFPGCPHFILDIFCCRTRDISFGFLSH